MTKQLKNEKLVKSHPNRWFRKESKIKAREFCAARRTSRTPQRRRDEAQRRDWTIYEVIKIKKSPSAGITLEDLPSPLQQA
jgi:hypothetical protein